MNTPTFVPEFLSWLGESALQIAGLSVIVLIVEIVAWRSLSARARFTLWSLVLLRVFLPPLPDPYNRVPRLIDLSRSSREIVESSPMIAQSQASGVAEPAAANLKHERSRKPRGDTASTAAPAVFVAAASASQSEPAGSRISIESMVVALWAAGFALSLGLLVWREERFRHRLRSARRVTDPQQLVEIETQARTMGVLRSIKVYATDLASGPASAGILSARLLLPSDFFSEGSSTSRRCVLLHELAHLRRLDGAGNLVIALAQAMQWFNPFLHLAARRFRAVREQVRDCEALSVANPPSPDHYAATLLDALERMSGDPTRGAMPAIGLLEPQEWKRRILMIRSFGRHSHSSTFASTVLVGAIASAVLVGASAKPMLPVSDPSDSHSGIRVERYAKPMPWLVELERGLAKRLDKVELSGSAMHVAKSIADLGGFRVSCVDDARPSFEERTVGLTLRDVTAREALEALAQMAGEIECVETPNGMVFTYPGNVARITESRFYSLESLLIDVAEEERTDRKSEIVDLVRFLCGEEGQWDRQGYGIGVFRDLLVVKADPRIHERTLAFLEQLSARRELPESLPEVAWERALEERLSKRLTFQNAQYTLRQIAERVRQEANITLIVSTDVESSEVELMDGECSVWDLCAKLAPSIGGPYPTLWNGAIRFAYAPRTEIGMYEIGGLVGAGGTDAEVTHRDELFDMVRNQVQPESWESCQAFVITSYRGLMIVRHTREAHDEIRAMLSALGRAMAGG